MNFLSQAIFLLLYQEIKLEWGKGLAQKREMEARLQELESEKDKPFARSRLVNYENSPCGCFFKVHQCV